MNPPRPRRPLPHRATTSGARPTLFVLGVTVGLLAASLVDRAIRWSLDRDIELVRAVRNLALEEYVRDVDRGELMEHALNGMLKELDDYSHFYGPQEIAALERETSGEFLGIGVVFRAGDPGRILFPYPGSPAERAGLHVGDRILSASGQPAGQLQSLLQGGDNELRLEIEGLEGVRRDVVLRPEVVLDPTVRHARMLVPEKGVGYLSIRSFSHRTPEEFDRAVGQLQEQEMRALVLDLRADPGGILDSAVSIANRFISAGALVATRSRDETRVTEASPEQATLAGLPLVVLIDSTSASASEVLAAALQDHAAAAIVGEPSYGKGTVQTLKHIGRERAVVKLTTASYCSPSLRHIEQNSEHPELGGVAPDLWVPLPAAERDRVHRFLFGLSPPESALEPLRAWEQRDGLDLIDEAPPDRQLDAAVALLTGGELDLHGDPLE